MNFIFIAVAFFRFCIEDVDTLLEIERPPKQQLSSCYSFVDTVCFV